MSAKQPSSIPFGENWANFLRRKDGDRRLVFLETFLKMAEGWTPGQDATDDEWDDYYMMQPLMSAHLNGKQGGRPKSETTTETPTETPKETPSKTTHKTVRREKKEGIEGSATRAGAREKKPPTIGQFMAMAKTAGVPEDFAVYLHGELESCSWTDGKGRTVDNPIRYMKSAWMAEQKKISAARASADDAFGGIRVG